MFFLKDSYHIDEALTAIDGRNKNKLTSLTPFFSEFALDKYRISVELRYLQFLSKYKLIRQFIPKETTLINRLIKVFDQVDYREIRKIEKTTNHDVKAVEEFIKLKLSKTTLRDVAEMVHFGLTSDDINNIAYGLIIKESLRNVFIPEIKKIGDLLSDRAKKYKSVPMLSRTHGQPAVSTTVGKEFLVYYKRLKEEIEILKHLKIPAKLTGNVGNLNVHCFIYPKFDWLKFSKEFIDSFGLRADLVTTQIESYDGYIRVFDSLKRINNILKGLCQDFWIYIMLGYFKQKVIVSEVGSTALPHKVNPIYFEGAEGGFGIANSLFEFYTQKLSYSRLQRDLSDSTVRRSFGIAFSYSLLSYQSVVEAIKRIEPDVEILNKDLESHWEVLSEAIQNFLKTKGYKNAYEKTKLFFRGRILKQEDVEKFIISLNLDRNDKEKLLELSPEKYIGYAKELVDKFSI